MMIRTRFRTTDRAAQEAVRQTVKNANDIIIAASGEKSGWTQPPATSKAHERIRTRFNKTMINYHHTAIMSAIFNNDFQDKRVLDLKVKDYIEYVKTALGIVWDNIEIMDDIE